MTIIITLILIGMAAILLELVLPGGIVGIAGALCLIGAIILTFIDYGINAGLLMTFGILVAACISLYFYLKYFERMPWIKPLILTETVGGSNSTEKQISLLNKTGKTLTDLGPSGKALIDKEKHDVIAESGYIDKDTAVTVVEADGSKIVVRINPADS